MKRAILILIFLLLPSLCFAASSRVLPSAYNEKTYDSAGGGEDYTSLATWEADTDIDLVTATKGEILTCSSGIHAENSAISYAGATVSSSYFRVIRAADGERGTTSSGVRFTCNASSNEFYWFCIQEAYFVVSDICGKLTNTSNNSRYFIVSNAASAKAVGCTFIGPGSTASTTGFAVMWGGILIAVNCYATNCGSGTYASGFLCSIEGEITTYNCTVTNSKVGFNEWFGVFVAKNCIGQGNTTNFTAGVSTTTCVTSGVTLDADGYHLDSTDTGAIDNGTDLSGDGTFAFDDDIDGETRSGDWDIGCDEYFAPAARRIMIIQ